MNGTFSQITISLLKYSDGIPVQESFMDMPGPENSFFATLIEFVFITSRQPLNYGHLDGDDLGCNSFVV